MPGDDRPTDRAVHERIVDQFSYRGEHADVWRAFDLVLDTDAYLNLGYSPWYLPSVVGSSQRRLAGVVGEGLADRVGATRGVRLLDVGCGRGGPSVVLAREHGFDVVGVDLVRFNVETARRNASRGGAAASFVVGDAASLPIDDGAVGAATAIDSLVYVPDERAAFEELSRVIRPGGVLAVSDLLMHDGTGRAGVADVEDFADAWDVARIVPEGRHLEWLAAAGFSVEAVRDLSPNSVDRFRKWARLYLGLADRAGGPTERLLGAWGLDADRITEQVRAAHEALPHLRHVLVYARAE